MTLLELSLLLRGCFMLRIIANIGVHMKRIMIKMGIHGIRHKIRESKLITWMKNNGIGASE